MFEELLKLTLFGSAVWYFILIGGFILTLTLSEAYENGFIALIAFAVFLALVHFGISTGVWTIFSVRNISIYLGIGLLFSAVRTFFYGMSKAKVDPIYKDKEQVLKVQREEMKEKLKNNVFRWWFMWPMSLIYWILSDLIKDLWDLIYGRLRTAYNYIADLGFNIKN